MAKKSSKIKSQFPKKKLFRIIHPYTIPSKINVTIAHLSLFRKLLSILVANLLAHNNTTISYYVQVNSPWLK